MHVVAHERGTAAVPRQVTLRTWFDRLVADTASTIVDDAPAPRRRQSAGGAGAGARRDRGAPAPRVTHDVAVPQRRPGRPGELDREAPPREGRADARRRPPSSSSATPAAPASGRSATSTPAPPRCTAVPGRSSARSSPTGSSPSPRTDMELQLTDEQGMLAESVRELLGRRSGEDGARTPAESGDTLWQELVDFGVLEIGPSEAELGTVDARARRPRARRASRRRPARRYGRAAPRRRT